MRIALSQWLGLSLVVLLLALPASTHALQESAHRRTAAHPHRKDAVHYKYQYAVDDPVSGVVNDRWEQRSGDFVKGQYSLLDPDGKVRTVDYEVDGERGFHAVIRTQYPAPALLSIQAASQVREVFQDSPVNIRAKAGIGIPRFVLQNPRFSARDNLPFNYHALDAGKLGLLEDDDGANLQLLDEDSEGALSNHEAQRRKFHRENHLLPHERFIQEDHQDQVVQQDVQQDLRHDDDLSSESNSLDATYPPSVFNPRAAYIRLHPRPKPLPPLPPPNPAVASTVPPPAALPVALRRVAVPSEGPHTAALRRVAVPSEGPHAVALRRVTVPSEGPHTAALRRVTVPSEGPHAAALRRVAVPSEGPHSALQALYGYGLHTLALVPPLPRGVETLPRARVVQHLTETSAGLPSSRSYFF